jgi:hypothetical protein
MSQPLTCSWSESICKKPEKKGGFCLKHYPRGSLLEAAKKKGVRVCDDGKRACRNETFNFKLKCEPCLKNQREKENAQYNERKEKGNCTMCGKVLESLTKGIKDDLLQKCEACYATSRKVEDTRTREKRNYSFERKINPERHFREYASSAIKKNVQFELTLEEFSEIVTKPCYYCRKYQDTEVLGIDRIDSFKGYVKGNVLPACELCNTMKKQLTMKEFADHIELLYHQFVCNFKETAESANEQTPPSYKYRPMKIVDLYSKKNLSVYIDLCKTDGRAATYVQKLVDATEYTMNNIEFRNYLENATRAEVRSHQLTLNNERKRIPRREILGLLASNKPMEAVKLYEAVFGTTNDISDDMKELALTWNTTPSLEREEIFNKYILKYNNARAYKKKSGAVDELVENEVCIFEEPVCSESLTKEAVQWKASNILKSFQTNTENKYKEYLEKDPPPNFNTLWNNFATSVKENHSTAQETIKEFILSLRTIRHNALSYKKNDCILDREDRQVWKNDSVLRAFKSNKLDKFKKFTEENTGDNPEDPAWCKRWDYFVESVESEQDDTVKKELITKFLTAQRTKKFRRSKQI